VERSIILKAHEVRGILNGNQTQLRRVVKPQPDHQSRDGITSEWCWKRTDRQEQARSVGFESDDTSILNQFSPFGQVGDRLWGKETYHYDEESEFVFYRAGGCYEFDKGSGGWTPSTVMPRNLSRILLEIVSVRVERLQDISADDCRAQGAPCDDTWDASVLRHAFFQRWDRDHGKGAHANSPFLWVVEFKRVTTDE